MKKVIIFIISLMIIVSSVTITQAAANSGSVNSTVNWELDNGILRITGYGELTN